MNHIRWAAWGVIDIEALERMQRRNYIKRARAEMAEKGIVLSCGGSTQTPWYSITLPTAKGEPLNKMPGAAKPGEKGNAKAAGGKGAFKVVCEWLLEEIGDVQQAEKDRMDNERSKDGGIWRAGAEA
jgi:hypothetical protein